MTFAEPTSEESKEEEITPEAETEVEATPENKEEVKENKEEAKEVLESLAIDSDDVEEEVEKKETRGRKAITGMADVFSKLIKDDKLLHELILLLER